MVAEVVLAIAFCVFGFLLLLVTCRKSPVQFHVKLDPIVMKVAGINIFPLVRMVLLNIPDGWRKYFVVKMNALDPSIPVRDRYDCTGESPYTVEELVEGKVWKVQYDMETIFITNSKSKEVAKKTGMFPDPNTAMYKEMLSAAARTCGEKAEQVVVDDIEKMKAAFNKDSYEKDKAFTIPPFSLHSFVVKLKSGSVLLYSPVTVRDETGFGNWLDTLGKVDWIIVASSMHTICLPAVLKRYPLAKIVGPPDAQAKLKFINALPRQKFDFDSTQVDSLKEANGLLCDEGVQLFYVAGDKCTNSLVAIVDKHLLLECDLLYGHDDGEGFLTIDQERWNQFLPEDWLLRLFKFRILCKPNGPNGFLALYRFQLMDCNSTSFFNYDLAEFDGSSCKQMAESLRCVLRLPFDAIGSVHCICMDREKFRRGIDKNWNWLDGHSLID